MPRSTFVGERLVSLWDYYWSIQREGLTQLPNSFGGIQYPQGAQTDVS